MCPGIEREAAAADPGSVIAGSCQNESLDAPSVMPQKNEVIILELTIRHLAEEQQAQVASEATESQKRMIETLMTF